MTLSQLVKELTKKLPRDKDTTVEAIVCTGDGRIVLMDIERNAVDMSKALRLFQGGK